MTNLKEIRGINNTGFKSTGYYSREGGKTGRINFRQSIFLSLSVFPAIIYFNAVTQFLSFTENKKGIPVGDAFK